MSQSALQMRCRVFVDLVDQVTSVSLRGTESRNPLSNEHVSRGLGLLVSCGFGERPLVRGFGFGDEFQVLVQWEERSRSFFMTGGYWKCLPASGGGSASVFVADRSNLRAWLLRIAEFYKTPFGLNRRHVREWYWNKY